MSQIETTSVPEVVFDLLFMELIDYVSQKGEEKGSYLIEKMGFQLGQRLAERFDDLLTYRYSRTGVRFHGSDKELDTIKYICREFWQELFNKSVDSLRTNRKVRLLFNGQVYMLFEGKLRWMRNLSPTEDEDGKLTEEEQLKVNLYAQYTSGVLRGALTQFGIPSTVKPTTWKYSPSRLASWTFTIEYFF